MAHPRMYSDDDPYLADLRKLCLALPEAVEVEAWVALHLSAASVDWQEVAELLETSYRQVALKRMLATLDRQA